MSTSENESIDLPFSHPLPNLDRPNAPESRSLR
jgi:hypothetical protein